MSSELENKPSQRSILVIGGGIAGIVASLELANLNFKVYLIERTPIIGGHMAQLAEVYPTLENAIEIIESLMKELLEHPNVKLLTYTEVQKVNRGVNDFRMKILRKPRFVEETKCNGCGECAKICPVEVPSNFDLGLSKRKAIYIPYSQAVPLIYTIDKDNCLYFQQGVCKSPCEQVCPTTAINYDQKEQKETIDVGAIIACTGYDLFDAEKIKEYGYGVFKNVLLGLQLERLCNANGPTKGKVVRPSDGREPESVAFILCVGSRAETALKHCCRVGCMTAVAQAYTLKKKFGDKIKIYVCYSDLRSYGKQHEDLYQEARNLGINFIRGIPAEIHELSDGSLTFDVFDMATNQLLRINVGLVILEVGLEPSANSETLGKILGIPDGPDGFFLEAHAKLRSTETAVPGIFLAGTAQGPKDITETIAHAKAAAISAVAFLTRQRSK